MAKKMMPKIIVVAFILIGFIATTQQSNAMTERTYKVRVTYHECLCGKLGCSGMTRSEIWMDEVWGDVVYIEIIDCQGGIHKTGSKPFRANSKGSKLWEQSVADRTSIISIAQAMACYYTPTSNESGESDIEDAVGDIHHITWEKYVYSFPEYMFVDEDLLANISYSQAANNITINTDVPVFVQLVELTTGNLMGDMFQVFDTSTISISSLAVGCKYAFIVYQEIDDQLVHIATEHFCR